MRRRKKIERVEEALVRARRRADVPRASGAWRDEVMTHVRALGPHRADFRDVRRAAIDRSFRKMAWASAAVAAATFGAAFIELAHPEIAIAWMSMGDATGFLSMMMSL